MLHSAELQHRKRTDGKTDGRQRHFIGIWENSAFRVFSVTEHRYYTDEKQFTHNTTKKASKKIFSENVKNCIDNGAELCYNMQC